MRKGNCQPYPTTLINHHLAAVIDVVEKHTLDTYVQQKRQPAIDITDKVIIQGSQCLSNTVAMTSATPQVKPATKFLNTVEGIQSNIREVKVQQTT